LNLYHLDYLLLKTFSTSPFQGQYPPQDVKRKKQPRPIEMGLQYPVRKKPNAIRTAFRITRNRLSAFETFGAIAISNPLVCNPLDI